MIHVSEHFPLFCGLGILPGQLVLCVPGSNAGHVFFGKVVIREMTALMPASQRMFPFISSNNLRGWGFHTGQWI